MPSATLPNADPIPVAFSSGEIDADILEAHAQRAEERQGLSTSSDNGEHEPAKSDPKSGLELGDFIERAVKRGEVERAYSDTRTKDKVAAKETNRADEKKKEPEKVVEKAAGGKAVDGALNEDDENERIAKGIPTKEARDAWNHKNGLLREANKKVAEYEAKLKEIEARPTPKNDAADAALQKEIEVVRERLARQEQIIERAAVQESDSFRQKFVEPLARAESGLDELAKDYGLELDLAALDKLRGKERAAAISELSSDMPPYHSNKFFALIEDRERLGRERATFLENAKSVSTAERASQREAADRKMSELRSKSQKATADTFAAMLEKEVPYLLPKDAPDDWKARMEEARTFATTTPIEELDEPSRASLMPRATLFPMMRAMLEHQRATTEKLRTQIAALRNGTPSAGGGHAAAHKQETEDENEHGIPKNAGLTEAFDIMMSKSLLTK